MPKASDFSAIYGIRHIASGRIYVGSAVRTNARWRHHRSQLQRGTHHSRYLQAAWIDILPALKDGNSHFTEPSQCLKETQDLQLLQPLWESHQTRSRSLPNLRYIGPVPMGDPPIIFAGGLPTERIHSAILACSLAEPILFTMLAR